MKRFVIFRQGQFGDTLVAFPLMEAIKELIPSTEIVYCTNSFKGNRFVLGREVLKLSPHIASIATYFVEDSVTQKWVDLKRQLSICASDVLLYLPYETVSRFQICRDWLFFKSLGFKKMYCFRELWRWAKELPGMKIRPKECDRLIDIVNSSIGLLLKRPAKCNISADFQWAQRKVDEWEITGKDVLAICPGSKMQSKRWPISRYAEVGRAWHLQTGAHLVIVGGPEDSVMADSLLKEWDGYGFSICGVSLSETAGMLAQVKAFCGNDTGSMHLAALLGKPCVALFSARKRPESWYPFGDNNQIIQSAAECMNCIKQTCFVDPSECMASITVQNVLDALRNVW